MTRPTIVLLVLLLGLVRGPLSGADLTVFAAASVSEALDAAAKAFTAVTEKTVHVEYGGSGVLARKIREGARADVFFSADSRHIDQLAKNGLIVADSRRDIVGNTLILIAPAVGGPRLQKPADLADSNVRLLALGNPAVAAAGAYAQDLLEKEGLWPAVHDKVIFLDSVRAVIAAVESGNADAGFVYKTDAALAKKVRIITGVTATEGPRIVFPAVVITGSTRAHTGRAFVAWLAGPEAQAIFVRHGFLPPPSVPEPAR
jgi:molybdate transport system substrate-binding protein